MTTEMIKPLTVPAETVMAHIPRYRQLAADDGLTSIVVSISSPMSPNATIGILPFSQVESLERALRLVVEMQPVAVFMDLIPNALFPCIEEQIAFCLITASAPKA